MNWRNVIITKRCKLDYKMGYLVIRGEQVQRIFLDEIALLMLENPAVSLTGCLMEALTEKKVKVIFCDGKRSPIAEVVPYHGSYDSSLAIRVQAQWTEEAKGLAWQRIIIRNAGAELRDAYSMLSEKVIDYMELVRQFDRDKLFVTVNFRSFVADDEAEQFMRTALSHGYHVIMVESSERKRLKSEKRLIIDSDLCEID